MGLRDILYDYSQVSSVSGVSRIGDQNRRIVARVFWTLALLVGTVLFCIQAVILIKKYFNYPKDVVTNLEFKVLQFPAVTICNINPFSEKLVAEGSRVAEYLDRLDAAIANDTKGKSKKTKKKLSAIQLQNKAMEDLVFLLMNEGNISPDSLYQRAKNMIWDCSYGLHGCQDNQFSAVDTFKECFTYNYEGKLPSARPGSEFGLRIRLDVAGENYLTSTDAAGVKVAIHKPGTFPFPSTLGYNAMTGARTSFGLTMVETTRLGNPYDNCTSKKDGNDVPYFYAGSYTLEGCLDSCLQQKIRDKCGCSHFKYPAPEGSMVCDMKKKECMITTEQELLASGDISPENCRCYQPCEEIKFKTTISEARYPAANYANAECDNEEDEKAIADCVADIHTHELEVEVYYESLNYQSYQENAAYPLVSLISDLGGQLGFWLGLSIVALYELVSLLVSLLGSAMGCVSKDIELKGSLKKPVKPKPHV